MMIERAVADDREQPRPRVAAREAVEVTERAEGRILNDVLRIVLVANEVPREIVGGIEMRHHDLFESLHFRVRHLPPHPRCVTPSNKTEGSPFLFPGIFPAFAESC